MTFIILFIFVDPLNRTNIIIIRTFGYFLPHFCADVIHGSPLSSFARSFVAC